MRKSSKLLVATAAAALVATAGTAFTNSNTGIEDTTVGYGSASISGVTVTNVAYNQDTTDASKLSSIVFTVTDDVSAGFDATLRITDDGSLSPDTGTATDCTIAATSITCSVSVAIEAVDAISLTVAPTEAAV